VPDIIFLASVNGLATVVTAMGSSQATMPNYRREYFGTKWFFTVVTHKRAPVFALEDARSCLRKAIEHCRKGHHFVVDAWVLLPDHIHCIWSLDATDSDFSLRWSIIKRRFTQQFRERSCGDPPFWQKRFWEHRIRDERDYENHVNYIHFNPVKHGYVSSPTDWPWTTFHTFVKNGAYPVDWGAGVRIPTDTGNE
jgi:putative transposase